MDNSYKLEWVWRYIHQGQYPQAIEQVKELLAQDPNNAMYHGVLALCLLLQMRIHAAQYELKIALQLDPMEPFFHLIQARIYYFQTKFKLALQACDEALKLQPHYADAFELKADILLVAKRNVQALECIKQMAALRPSGAATAQAFAEYYFKTGDKTQAFSFAAQALAADAQHLDANILMGRLHLLKGDVDEALYHARLAVMLSPAAPAALGLLADIKSRQNFFLAPWWKFNAKISQLSQMRQVGVLIFGFVFFGFLSNIVYDLGYAKASSVIDYAWLALVIYSWVALPVYYRMVAKEIEQFKFKADY